MRTRIARIGLAGLAAGALGIAACGEDPEQASAPRERQDDRPQVAIQAAENGPDFREIYDRDAPGVVTIRSVFGGSILGGAGQGTGFVIDDGGEIVTNAHVVTDIAETRSGAPAAGDEASEVYVEFGDRNTVEAEIVGTDLEADIALLQIDPDEIDADLVPLELGDSDAVAVGEPVATIGSPFGQTQSLSTGIVSATDRGIDSLTNFQISGGIQTDASINPGNSGGPLINGAGQVIGVNQQIATASGANDGVGFAIPINLARSSIEDLRDDGEASYAYIGVQSQALYPQLAVELGIDAPTGSLIAEVLRGGPAEEAGLEGADGGSIEFQGIPVDTGGDVIVSVDGEELVGPSDLGELIAEREPGEEVTLEIVRDGDREEITVTLGERPSGPGGRD